MVKAISIKPMSCCTGGGTLSMTGTQVCLSPSQVETSVFAIRYPFSQYAIMATLDVVGIPFESTKGLTLSMLLCSGLVATGVLLKTRLHILIALGVGLLVAANPVGLAQVFTRMNDGILVSLLVIVAFLIALSEWKANRWALIGAALLMTFAVNVKFTAIPMLVIVCSAACLAVWRLKGWKEVVPLAVPLMGREVL